MEEKNFNLPEYVHLLNDEEQNLEQEFSKLEERMKVVDWARLSLKNYQKELYELNSKIGKLEEKNKKQKEEIDTLRQNLFDVTAQKKGMIAEMEIISKQNAELEIQKNEQRALFEMTARQLSDEKRMRMDLEMNLAETRKLMDSIAKKSSEEGIQKAIQTFVNYSKRKTSDKRTYIKNTILEFTSVNRISLPEELSSTIDCLDDEQTEPKSVTMNGGVYNDIHDNGTVNQK